MHGSCERNHNWSQSAGSEVLVPTAAAVVAAGGRLGLRLALILALSSSSSFTEDDDTSTSSESRNYEWLIIIRNLLEN